MNFQANVYLSVIHLQAVGHHSSSQPTSILLFICLGQMKKTKLRGICTSRFKPLDSLSQWLYTGFGNMGDQINCNGIPCTIAMVLNTSPLVLFWEWFCRQEYKHCNTVSLVVNLLTHPNEILWSMLLQASERLRTVNKNSTAFLLIFQNGGQAIWS